MKADYSGKVLHGYCIERKVRDGLVADVYSARLSGSEHAVKITAARNATAEHHHLLRELCSLQHENLVLPTEVFTHYRNIVEVMPFVHHPRLFECSRNISYADACTLMTQLLSGLAYLHDRDIGHRDAHAHNIFINRSATKLLLYDFGISKKMRRSRRKNAIAWDMQSAALTFEVLAYRANKPKVGAPFDLEKILDPIADGRKKIHSAEEFLGCVIHR